MPPERLVSAIIPVHDGRPYLAEALESVFAQSHTEVEAIVIDDGSSDGSGELARSFEPRVRVVSQDRGGDGAARNRGVSLAEGAFLAFLDADDIWAPDKLERQLDALDDPDTDLVFAHLRQFRSPELEPDAGRYAGDGAEMPAPSVGTLVLARATFDRVGPFGSWRVGSFMDWLDRARALGLRERVLPEVLLHRRLHPGSHTVQERAHFGDYARILKSSLDRKRGVR